MTIFCAMPKQPWLTLWDATEKGSHLYAPPWLQEPLKNAKAAQPGAALRPGVETHGGDMVEL